MSVTPGLSSDGLALLVPHRVTGGHGSRAGQMTLRAPLLIDKCQRRGMQRPLATMDKMAKVWRAAHMSAGEGEYKIKES